MRPRLDLDATSTFIVMTMHTEWSIQQIAKLAGTTSRTLRHYDELGLLPPTRIAANGYRHYDGPALVRLQRILLLRDLGLSLAQIADVLARPVAEAEALRAHLAWLRDEQQRLERQIAAVASTITTLTEGKNLMAEDMFDGFDHTQYQEEVAARWGAETAAQSDRWWRGLGAADHRAWQAEVAALNAAWQDAADRGIPADGPEAAALADRHVAWLAGIPGTPRGDDLAGYLTGLGDMYVADPRFARNYGGEQSAALVRDALRAYLAR